PALPDFAALARRGRPLWSFSYTSLEQGLRGQRPPEDAAERTESAYAAGPGDAEGPAGGARLGTLVHALLEAVPLESLRGRSLEAWREDPATVPLLAPFRREDRETVAAWAHAALAGSLPLPGGGAAVVAEAPRVLRELDFLTPYPGGPDLLNGSIDLLFQWEGKAYLADWKTNRLPGYGPEPLAAKVKDLYELQLKAYTVTARRFLGLDSREAWDAGFGGFLYVFLRGLPGAGVWSARPSWDDVVSWEKELAALPTGTLIPVAAGGARHA
ncbi:MAG TPA: PD-(D/E)XK nuclease family protein, partial [Holophaga sp.]|nr:PD-(D/E)XK nuclease family protein [Holophaga sp.]